MAKDKFTVEVNAKIIVDKVTAEGCLSLVAMYMNEHNVYIKEEMASDGTVSLSFENRK